MALFLIVFTLVSCSKKDDLVNSLSGTEWKGTSSDENDNIDIVFQEGTFTITDYNKIDGSWVPYSVGTGTYTYTYPYVTLQGTSNGYSFTIPGKISGNQMTITGMNGIITVLTKQ